MVQACATFIIRWRHHVLIVALLIAYDLLFGLLGGLSRGDNSSICSHILCSIQHHFYVLDRASVIVAGNGSRGIGICRLIDSTCEAVIHNALMATNLLIANHQLIDVLQGQL